VFHSQIKCAAIQRTQLVSIMYNQNCIQSRHFKESLNGDLNYEKSVTGTHPNVKCSQNLASANGMSRIGFSLQQRANLNTARVPIPLNPSTEFGTMLPLSQIELLDLQTKNPRAHTLVMQQSMQIQQQQTFIKHTKQENESLRKTLKELQSTLNERGNTKKENVIKVPPIEEVQNNRATSPSSQLTDASSTDYLPSKKRKLGTESSLKEHETKPVKKTKHVSLQAALSILASVQSPFYQQSSVHSQESSMYDLATVATSLASATRSSHQT